MDIMGRVPPQCIDVEKAILGSMIIDNQIISDILDSLKLEHFYKPTHREVYEAIRKLHDSGQAVDILTTEEELKSRGSLEKCGGIVYLSELVSTPSTTTNSRKYTEIIKNKALRRAYIKAASDILNIAYDETIETQDLTALAENRLLDIETENHTETDITSCADKVMNGLIERTKNPGALLGISTGFRAYDYMIGGLESGLVYLIGARPSMGKTAFGLNISWYVASYLKKNVLFFSLEMTKVKILNRLLSGVSSTDNKKMRIGSLTPTEIDKLKRATKEIKDSGLHIIDEVGLTIDDISSKARKAKIKLKSLDLIVIDHLTEIKGKGKELRLDVTDNARAIKQLAKQLNCPIILLCQLNRGVEGRQSKKPTMGDLRESGALEEIADVVTFLYRESYYTPTADRRDAEIITAKNRDGKTGNIKLHFYGSTQHSRIQKIHSRRLTWWMMV